MWFQYCLKDSRHFDEIIWSPWLLSVWQCHINGICTVSWWKGVSSVTGANVNCSTWKLLAFCLSGVFHCSRSHMNQLLVADMYIIAAKTHFLTSIVLLQAWSGLNLTWAFGCFCQLWCSRLQDSHRAVWHCLRSANSSWTLVNNIFIFLILL
jgi:hypothetical protein